MISIRTFSNTKPLYLAFENKYLKAYEDLPQIQAHNNMTFFVKENKTKIIIKIITLNRGSLKSTIGSNLLGVIETNIKDGTPYIVIPTNKTGGKFDIFKNQFSYKIKKHKIMLILMTQQDLCMIKIIYQHTNGIFNLEPSNGYYKILNITNQNLILYDRNLIKFVNSNDVISNENLFNIDIEYELL